MEKKSKTNNPVGYRDAVLSAVDRSDCLILKNIIAKANKKVEIRSASLISLSAKMPEISSNGISSTLLKKLKTDVVVALL